MGCIPNHQTHLPEIHEPVFDCRQHKDREYSCELSTSLTDSFEYLSENPSGDLSRFDPFKQDTTPFKISTISSDDIIYDEIFSQLQQLEDDILKSIISQSSAGSKDAQNELFDIENTFQALLQDSDLC